MAVCAGITYTGTYIYVNYNAADVQITQWGYA